MGVDGLSLWLPELPFPESVVTSAQKNSVVKDKICVHEAEQSGQVPGRGGCCEIR